MKIAERIILWQCIGLLIAAVIWQQVRQERARAAMDNSLALQRRLLESQSKELDSYGDWMKASSKSADSMRSYQDSCYALLTNLSSEVGYLHRQFISVSEWQSRLDSERAEAFRRAQVKR